MQCNASGAVQHAHMSELKTQTIGIVYLKLVQLVYFGDCSDLILVIIFPIGKTKRVV